MAPGRQVPGLRPRLPHPSLDTLALRARQGSSGTALRRQRAPGSAAGLATDLLPHLRWARPAGLPGPAGRRGAGGRLASAGLGAWRPGHAGTAELAARPADGALLGIAVLVPNVRGSTGYGRAYAALDDRELRLDSVRDLAAAHAWLSGQQQFDGQRIGIMGQSYGGWMVLAAVTEYPELWAAGVDYYGIARWKTFFERTGPWRVGHRAAEYGDPVRDMELLERLSPLHKTEEIRCPMLVAQGMTDPRVPPHESEQIVQALKRRNVPVEYLTFPDEGHGFLKRDNRRRVYLGVASFLAQHLRPDRG
ncbi:alpha/beta hydrolase family protein [Pseudoroseomonas wenyumeiae]